MKNKYVTITVVLLAILLSSNECKDDMDCRLKFTNNSDETIWFDIGCFNLLDSTEWLGNCFDKKVLANSSSELCNNSSWDELFISNKLDKLTIVATNYDTALKYSIDQIMKNEKFLKKFQYTFDDLEVVDWNIVYP